MSSPKSNITCRTRRWSSDRVYTTSSMILIPVCLLAAFQPGVLFPQMAERMAVGPVQSIRNRRIAAKEAKAAENSGGNGNGSAGEELREKTAVPGAVENN